MNLKEIDILELYHKWCLGSGYFEAFIRSGPFVSLKYFDNMRVEVPKEKDKGFFYIIEKYLEVDEKQLILIDIDGTLAMEIGYKINKKYNLWPIIIFNFLLHPYGLVGDNDFINALIYYGNLLSNENLKDILILLDYNRFNDVEENKFKECFNNQYEFSEEDLPNVEMINTLKYSKVLCFYQDDEKEDIKYYLEYLRNNNILVESVKLSENK